MSTISSAANLVRSQFYDTERPLLFATRLPWWSASRGFVSNSWYFSSPVTTRDNNRVICIKACSASGYAEQRWTYVIASYSRHVLLLLARVTEVDSRCPMNPPPIATGLYLSWHFFRPSQQFSSIVERKLTVTIRNCTALAWIGLCDVGLLRFHVVRI